MKQSETERNMRIFHWLIRNVDVHGCLCPLSLSLSKDVGFGNSWHHGGEWHQGHHPAVEEHTTHHTEHHEFHTEQKDLPCPQFSYG